MQSKRQSTKTSDSSRNNTSRHMDASVVSRNELIRPSSTGNKRSHKLEVSFLLNQSHTSSGNARGSGVPYNGSTSHPSSSLRVQSDKRGHNVTSVGQRRFGCEFCRATFAQSHDALKHKRTVHEKLRPYTCDICGKSFGEKGNLSKHKKSVHLNERPFPCDFCSSTFAFKDGLQRHRSLVHLDLRPFVCKKCNADFKQISQLRKHKCSFAGASSSRDGA